MKEKPTEKDDNKGQLLSKQLMAIDKLERKEQWDEWAWNMKLKVKAVNQKIGTIIDEIERAELEDDSLEI